MPIDYLPGIEPGQKIDLSRFQKPERSERLEDSLPFLKEKLSTMSEEVNREYGDFLDKDGKIKLAGPESQSDSKLVEQQELGFSQGCRDVAEWKKKSEADPAGLTEMALTLALDRWLKGEFIVARSSSYDDYNHGVDHLLIDKKTGQPICGFDEVISAASDGSAPKKEAKLGAMMARGGARMKYGAKLEDGALKRQPLRDLPAFYLSLTKSELSQLISSLKQPAGDSLSPAEAKISERLLESLRVQSERPANDAAIRAKAREALGRLSGCFKLAQAA